MESLSQQQELLKEQLKLARENISENQATRLHRAISWLGCAVEQSDNVDLQLISLWISFNALYAVDEGGSESLAERFAFLRFVKRVFANVL